MKEKILKIIYQSIVEFNSSYDIQISIENYPDIYLYGKNSSLDSIGLVNLVVLIETKIEDEIGTSVSLTSEKALSQKRSPFQTVESLAEFIYTSLNEMENE